MAAIFKLNVLAVEMKQVLWKEYYGFKHVYYFVILASRLYQNIAGKKVLPKIQKIINLPKWKELQLNSIFC